MNDAQAQAPATQASQPAQGTLWKRSDQAQHQRLAEGSRLTATATSPLRKRFEGIDNDAGWYNLGNTLAREGNYDEAIAAYDRAGVASRHGRCGRQPCRGRCRAQAQAVRWQRPGSAEATAERAAEAAERCPGQQNPQGQKPQQGQQNPGQGQQGQPRRVTTRTRRARPASAAAMASRRHHRWRMPRHRQADEQQRQRMQQRCSRHAKARLAGRQTRTGAEGRTPREREEQQAVEAWMRRVPDDPGALLRAKFQLENERRKREGR